MFRRFTGLMLIPPKLFGAAKLQPNIDVIHGEAPFAMHYDGFQMIYKIH
jgi:hypothetical protein